MTKRQAFSALWAGFGLLAVLTVPARADSPAVSVETASGHPDEVAVASQVTRLIDQYDLHDWQFTKRILVDKDTRIPHSHPVLTLNTRYVDNDPETLTNIIHEQLHWFVLQNQSALGAAVQEVRARYPDAPDGPPGGARDLRSTYLHLVVCSLEFIALERLIGRQAAAKKLTAKPYYTWVFDTVVEDAASLRPVLKKHGIVLP